MQRRVLRALLLIAGVLISAVLWFNHSAIFPWESAEQRLFSVEQDLNEAYRVYHPFLYRWPRAPYPVSSNDSRSVPRSTLAEALADLQVAEHSLGRSARSLRLLGRIEILAGNYDEALKAYHQALLWSPEDSAVQLELAIGFSLRARAENRALDLERALEALLSISETDSTPELRFDKALLFEDIPLPSQAAIQWQMVIDKENSPIWCAEARTRLARLKLLRDTREKRAKEITESPSSYLAHAEQANSSIEVVLSAALQDWLPRVHDSITTRQAMNKLAEILNSRFHDAWLSDFLQIQDSGRSQDAVNALSESIRANLQGEHLRAQAEAALGEKLFHELGNVAGELRSRVELIYALDRLWQQKHCLRALNGLRSVAHIRGYVWIEGQAQLEEIACETQTRQIEVISGREQAFAWISQTGYEGLSLRALSFLTEQYGGLDSRLRIWQYGHEGLRRFWLNPMSANRGYTFYYTLATSARAANHKRAAVMLLLEGVETIRNFPYQQLYALALSNLGFWESEVGQYADADLTFNRMESVFQGLKKAEAHFWRDAEITRTEAAILEGNHLEARAHLSEIIKDMKFPYPNFGSAERRRLMPALGDTYLAEDKLDEASRCYRQIVFESARDSRFVRNQSQRYEAQREIENAWRGLTEISIRQGAVSKALAVWEAFRDHGGNTSPSTAIRPPVGVAFLAYSFLPHGLSAWFADAHGVEQRWLDNTTLNRDLEEFTLLISDPESPIPVLHEAARRLYATLVEPFEDLLPPSAVLIIDTDGPLGRISWSALEDTHGRPLVERFAICQAAGWIEASSSPFRHAIDFSRSLVVGNPTLSGEWASQYPPLTATISEVEWLHKRLPQALFLQNTGATAQELFRNVVNASFFHFGGHGVGYGGFGALLLAASPKAKGGETLVTADQIRQLSLKHLQLVVLAACSSGVGEEFSVVDLDSLVRSFIEAGAWRVVAARWNVNSPETADLMTQFYENLFQGKQPAEALRIAALFIRGDSRTSHPYYWAGFQVFGVP